MVDRAMLRSTAIGAVETKTHRRFMASEGRKMYDVRVYNLKCVECGKPVVELPFQPLTSTRPVYCRDCNQNRRPAKKKPYRGKPKRRRR
jgi:CxxC-x17-CxxC domain-containing protein